MLSFSSGAYSDYMNKGESDIFDFQLEDLIADDQLHELDLSSMVPKIAANKLVCLDITLRNTIIETAIVISENGYVDLHNSTVIRTQTANVKNQGTAWVKMDADYKIQYKLQNVGVWNCVNVVVRGWFEKVGGGLTNGS